MLGLVAPADCTVLNTYEGTRLPSRRLHFERLYDPASARAAPGTTMPFARGVPILAGTLQISERPPLRPSERLVAGYNRRGLLVLKLGNLKAQETFLAHAQT